MRLALGQLSSWSDSDAQFACQLGLSGLHYNTPDLPYESGYWSYDDLVRLRDRCESYGLALEALENVPMAGTLDFMLGTARAEEALQRYCLTIQNMGRAGIPILGHHFMPAFVWRTDIRAVGRGGAQVSAFDGSTSPLRNAVRYPQADVSKAVDAETMWDNYRRFLAATVPVAEDAGVRLALHPDDPPVPRIGAMARLFWSIENLEIAADMVGESPAWGLDLCLGTVSEMDGARSVRRAIDLFGPDGRIVYVHFRDIQGTAPDFKECFLGEGNFDPLDVLRHLQSVGFDGFLIDDHVPGLVDDSAYGHRARAHAVGYIQALVRAVKGDLA